MVPRTMSLALALLVSLSTAAVLLQDELLIEGDHVVTNGVPARITLLHVSRKDGGSADLRSLLESSTLLGTGSRNGIRFIPLGTQYDHLSAHMKKELIQSAFAIYIKGIELEMFVANVWYYTLLGEEDLAQRFESRTYQRLSARKAMLRKFQAKFDLSFLEVPFFGQRRSIRIIDDAAESLDSLYGDSDDVKRRALSAAKNIYLMKLKLDKIVGAGYKGLYTGQSGLVHQAKLISMEAKQLRFAISMYKVRFGISVYEVPIFGRDLNILEGRRVRPETSTDSDESEDTDEDEYDDSDGDTEDS